MGIKQAKSTTSSGETLYRIRSSIPKCSKLPHRLLTFLWYEVLSVSFSISSPASEGLELGSCSQQTGSCFSCYSITLHLYCLQAWGSLCPPAFRPPEYLTPCLFCFASSFWVHRWPFLEIQTAALPHEAAYWSCFCSAKQKNKPPKNKSKCGEDCARRDWVFAHLSCFLAVSPQNTPGCCALCRAPVCCGEEKLRLQQRSETLFNEVKTLLLRWLRFISRLQQLLPAR